MDHWQLPTRRLDLSERPLTMGILNVTPDSFSDGGRFAELQRAVEHGLRLIADGADILDIGGESTRPDADEVDIDEELRRIIPVIQELRKQTSIPLSIDTRKAAVATEAIRAGAEIVNDVSAASDPDMIPLLRETGAAVCIMHALGTPKTMQLDPRYENVVDEVYEFLRRKRDELVTAGIERSRIAVDPGLGFGKTVEHNWTLVRNIVRFLELDCPLLVGHSRKRFIAATFEDREEGTRIVSRELIRSGVQILRLHSVADSSSSGGNSIEIGSGTINE